MNFENSLEFALAQDGADTLKHFRDKFIFPKKDGKDVLYFSGNSLGLQPYSTRAAILQEIDEWADRASGAHLEAKNPWFSYQELFAEPLAKLTGALPSEVVAMNSLTVNLHLLMVSFYRPAGKRYRILCESKAFPSDQYVMQSQARFHGYDPDDAIAEVTPRTVEASIRTEDIIRKIELLGDELALVLFGGVNYYTGQAFDMEAITRAAHNAGAVAGFDLAHAIGNLKLSLHDWNVDFAVWCSYKYLNSGPGSVGGAFIHESHGNDNGIPRFTGWWGNDPQTRFRMEKKFRSSHGAQGWQLSNAPVLQMAAHKAALDIFDEAGIDALRAKSENLTGYLEFVIKEISPEIKIITPADPYQRGCQLSLEIPVKGRELHERLLKHGIITDFREPDVLRIAPAPLYNSYEDIYKFGEVLKEVE